MTLLRVYPRRVAYDAYQITDEWLAGPGPARLGLSRWHDVEYPDKVILFNGDGSCWIEGYTGNWILVDTEGVPEVYSDEEFRKLFEEVIF